MPFPPLRAAIAAYKKGLANSMRCKHYKPCSIPCCGEPHAVENRIGQGKKHSSRSILRVDRAPQGDHFRLLSISPCILLLATFPLSLASLRLLASSEQRIL